MIVTGHEAFLLTLLLGVAGYITHSVAAPFTFRRSKRPELLLRLLAYGTANAPLRGEGLDGRRRPASADIRKPQAVHGKFERPLRFEIAPELVIVDILELPDRIGQGDESGQ